MSDIEEESKASTLLDFMQYKNENDGLVARDELSVYLLPLSKDLYMCKMVKAGVTLYEGNGTMAEIDLLTIKYDNNIVN